LTLPKTAIIATVVVVAAIVVVAAAFPTVVFFSSFFIQSSHAQIATTTTPTTTPTAAAPEYYADTVNGFRVQVPSGWIAVDRSMATVSPELDEESRRNVLEAVGTGAETVAHLCPESVAVPVVGGGFECPIVAEPIKIGVEKYHFDLQAMQQFGDIIESGGDITTHDLLAANAQFRRNDS
jgi:hypothetical protein